MRLENEITLNGEFWIAGSDEEQIGGRLTISDGGAAGLEIYGVFDGHRSLDNAHFQNYFCIVGRLEDGKLVTLDRCIYRSRKIAFGGMDVCRFICTYVYWGLVFEGDTSIEYSWATFSFEGLEYFSLLGAFDTSMPSDETVLVSYTQPETIAFELYDTCRLHMSCAWVFKRGDPPGASTTIRAKPGLCLTYTQPVPAEVIRRDIAWFQRLLLLAMGECLNLKDVKAYISENGKDTGIGWCYESRPFNPSPLVHNNKRLLFTASSLGPSLGVYLRKWYANREKLLPALDLYFSSVSHERYAVRQRFLWLAQAVEPLYRVLNPKVSGVEYLEQVYCLAEYLDQQSIFVVDLDCFSCAIRDARNYLTHYNPDFRAKVPEGRDFHVMSSDLRALVALTILRVIEFTDHDLMSAAKSGQLYQFK